VVVAVVATAAAAMVGVVQKVRVGMAKMVWIS
jgi:hypothetical protein